MDVYVVSLPEDADRLGAVLDQLRRYPYVNPIPVAGVRGSLLPDAACRLLTRNKWSVNHKGTLGCFLSHVRIWEMVSEAEAGFAVVMEDDIELGDLDALAAAALPADCDLLWCNARTAYPSEGGAQFRPVSGVMAHVQNHGRAIGTDCYLITKAGAQKLLSYVETDSLFTHVDLRMMTYCLTPEEGAALKSAGRISDNICSLRATYAADHKLTGYSFWPPVTTHMAAAASRREAEDKARVKVVV